MWSRQSATERAGNSSVRILHGVAPRLGDAVQDARSLRDGCRSADSRGSYSTLPRAWPSAASNADWDHQRPDLAVGGGSSDRRGNRALEEVTLE